MGILRTETLVLVLEKCLIFFSLAKHLIIDLYVASEITHAVISRAALFMPLVSRSTSGVGIGIWHGADSSARRAWLNIIFLIDTIMKLPFDTHSENALYGCL